MDINLAMSATRCTGTRMEQEAPLSCCSVHRHVTCCSDCLDSVHIIIWIQCISSSGSSAYHHLDPVYIINWIQCIIRTSHHFPKVKMSTLYCPFHTSASMILMISRQGSQDSTFTVDRMCFADKMMLSW